MHLHLHGKPMGHGAARDYGQTPLNVYWEMTQACGLACKHCRAEAMRLPRPNQLTREESFAFLRQIPEFGDPLPQLILTGGDPMERADLYDLIDEARRLKIGVSITPAATPLLTRDVLVKLMDHGAEGLGLSLDGPTAATHDSIRGVGGCFDITVRAARWAAELDLPVQINTLVAAETAPHLAATYELVQSLSPARWSLFFLIAVGRGRVLSPVSPEDGEKLMHWIFDTARRAPFMVATTEAPSYRRVALERMRADGLAPVEMRGSSMVRGFGIRDGHGIVFVSNTGDISPAGFLPLVAGNVRKDRVADIYRNAPLFRSLHDPKQLKGRCGDCEHHSMCGGSRSRAFAATGDPLETDPLCPYEPRG